MSPQDKAEFDLLMMSNEKGKFGIQVDYPWPNSEMQLAFERGTDRQWFTLVDVATPAGVPALMRIFRLTEAGKARLSVLGALQKAQH